ncbi:MAG: cysteine desulfurase, partial [Calditrichaeota bacterium]|nr:cysteine desulfurase [Calditrichota bacterium]
MQRIYLDYAATTPVDERVLMSMSEFMLEKFGNPSSLHSYGREARGGIDAARRSIARMLNCRVEEVHFTSGGTEADNLALIGYAKANHHRGEHIVISGVEHSAVRSAAEALSAQGFRIGIAEPDAFGMIAPEAVECALESETILVSVMHANNEVGTINPLGAIGAILKPRGIAFHTDAVQSFGKIPVDVQALGVDMLSLSGHKIYGPKGIGAIYIRDGIQIEPRQLGGHQESGIRPGTENLSGIVGLGVAASLAESAMAEESNRMKSLRDELHARILDHIEDAGLNGHSDARLPGHLNLSFHGIDGEALLVALDLEGVAASSGSACASGSQEPSSTLLAMGVPRELAQASLRLTLGRSTTAEDVGYAARIIVDNVTRLR